MKRREFLIKGGSVLLVLPAGWAVTSCDDDDDDLPTPNPNPNPNPNPYNDAGTGTSGSGGSGGSGGNSGSGGSGGSGGSSDAGGGSILLRFTSSVVGGHSHQFEFDALILRSPPANGLSGNTSLTNGHLHTVELTAAELTQIAGGTTVTKDSSLVSGHLHTFQFGR